MGRTTEANRFSTRRRSDFLRRSAWRTSVSTLNDSERSLATRLRASALRATTTTLYEAAASCLANSSPNPVDAPVTNAHRPFTSMRVTVGPETLSSWPNSPRHPHGRTIGCGVCGYSKHAISPKRPASLDTSPLTVVRQNPPALFWWETASPSARQSECETSKCSPFPPPGCPHHTSPRSSSITRPRRHPDNSPPAPQGSRERGALAARRRKTDGLLIPGGQERPNGNLPRRFRAETWHAPVQ